MNIGDLLQVESSRLPGKTDVDTEPAPPVTVAAALGNQTRSGHPVAPAARSRRA